MSTIQHIKYLLASEYVHKTLSLVESSELKVALFAGNVQEKRKPVARLVILFDSSLKFCVFSHLGSLFLGAKKKKLKPVARLVIFLIVLLSFMCFFTLFLDWWFFLTVSCAFLRLDSLFLGAKKDCILLKFKRSQCRFPAQIPFLTFSFLFSTVGALVVLTV